MPDIDEQMRETFREAMAPVAVKPPPVAWLKSRAGDTAPASRRPRWRIAAAGGVAVAAATTAVLTVPGLVGWQAPWERPAVAAVLDQAADAAAARPQPRVPGPDEFVYSRDIAPMGPDGSSGTGCWLIRETWESGDGRKPGYNIMTEGVAKVRHDWMGDPRKLPRQPGCPYLYSAERIPPANTYGGAWQVPDAAFVRSLPTDADDLYQRVLKDSAGHGEGGDRTAFVYLTDLLRTNSPFLTPAVRAAALRAIAKVPGVVRVEGTVDLMGRTGVTITGPGPEGDSSFVVDPATGEVIGTGTGANATLSASTVVSGVRVRPPVAPR